MSKRNVQKQEAVVGVLWDFAAKAQANIADPTCARRVSDGTKLRLEDVEEALTKILSTFGYPITDWRKPKEPNRGH